MDIVASIKQGDELVYQQVFEQYHVKLYLFIFNKTKSPYIAEEVVQIAFEKLWDRRHTLNEDYTISTQLFRIASTSLIDLLRQHNTRALFLKDMQQDGVSLNDHSSGRLEEKELNARLTAAINQLSPVRRKVFEMSRFRELSYREIAEELSISTKTVENHISRALEQIRKALKTIVLQLIFIFLNNQ